MKVSGTNPVHILFAILRDRVQGGQSMPKLSPDSEALKVPVSGARQTATPTDKKDEVNNAGVHVVVSDDQVAAIAAARLRSKVSFSAADGMNRLSQHASGRSWELAAPDTSHSGSVPGVVPHIGHPGQTSRFTPTPADISEAMDVWAAVNVSAKLMGSTARNEKDSDSDWTPFLGRFATALLGASILILIVSVL